eukprot:2530890-Pyramimonas_sp.AAC.1
MVPLTSTVVPLTSTVVPLTSTLVPLTSTGAVAVGGGALSAGKAEDDNGAVRDGPAGASERPQPVPAPVRRGHHQPPPHAGPNNKGTSAFSRLNQYLRLCGVVISHNLHLTQVRTIRAPPPLE